MILFSISLAFSFTLFFTFYVVAAHNLNVFLIFLEEATLLQDLDWEIFMKRKRENSFSTPFPQRIILAGMGC